MKYNRKTYGVLLAILGVVLFLYLATRERSEGFQGAESRTVDLVVARYKENLDWLNEYKDTKFQNVFVYNKSDDPVEECSNEYANCVIKKLPNVGVCDHTYLYHIIENYDTLADVTVFAPGSANLDYKKSLFKYTLDRAVITKNSLINVFKFDVDADKAMYNFRVGTHVLASKENHDMTDFSNVPATPTPYGPWFQTYFPDVHTKYSSFIGIFAASKEHIQQRPKSFYEGLIQQVNKSKFHEASHFIERAWFAILNPTSMGCIYQSPIISDLMKKLDYFKNVRRNVEEGFQEATVPTFHILIATAGRSSLKNLLDSLKDELTEQDAITIVFDGADAEKKSGYDESWFLGHRSTHMIKTQVPNLGAGIGGEPVRTKYQTTLKPETTYIMYADDDDTYIKGSFETLRTLCKNPEVLYIAKMNYADKPGLVIPRQNKEIIQNDIGTPNGIVPFKYAGKAEWGMRYGGDFDFYNALKNEVEDLVFLDLIIYTVATSRYNK